MRAPDWVLLGALSALFAISLVLHLRAVERTGLGGPGILVSPPPSPDDYPRVAQSLPGLDGTPLSLPLGARILRVGDLDVRGMGEISFTAASLEAVRDGRLDVWIDRGMGPELRGVAAPRAVQDWWWYLPLSLSLASL